jgi:hypothetical protein
MTPEYLNELADIADPEQLWRLNPLDQMELEPILRLRLDTGVALRRYAEIVRQLDDLLGTGKSLVLTPLSRNGKAWMTIPAPDSHKRLLDLRASTGQEGSDV